MYYDIAGILLSKLP